MLNTTKTKTIKATADNVARKLGCTHLEAVTSLQAAAARNKNEDILGDLIAYKRTLIS